MSTGSNMTSSSSGMMDVCGDGTVGATEGCDDNGTTPGDGCDGNCQIETGFDCAGEPSVCTPHCGDGIVVTGEACDDMNAMPGDGCSMTCTVEHGFDCDNSSGKSVCTSTCGDGVLASNEECDDHNTDPLDGCDASCNNEDGWTCTMADPSVCTVTGCGDGFMVGMEPCDDGNQIPGDGCSAGCQLEMGFNCTGTAPTVCVSVCGDGLIVGTETCDDSNATANDCCTGCKVDPGCETEVNNSTMVADDYATTQVGQKIHGFINPVGDADFFVFTVPAGQTFDFRASTGPGILGTVCASSSVAAGIDSRIELLDSTGTLIIGNNDTAANYCSSIQSIGLAAGTYYIKVLADPSPGTNTTWDYDLNVTLVAQGCPNGFVDPGEVCDDNNSTAGDGCSPACQLECPGVAESEPNGSGAQASGPINPGVGNCGSITPAGDKDFFTVVLTSYSDLSFETFEGDGTTCATADTVIRFYAADGTTQIATDDEGGINSCSKLDGTALASMKHLAPGTYFIEVEDYAGDGNDVIPSYQVKMTVNASCGNGVKEGSEACDGTMGCAADCTIIPVCGNGTLEAGEQCDQGSGNVTNGDGCSSTCQIEPGYICMGTPSMCMIGQGQTCMNAIVASNGFNFVGSNIAAYGDDLNFTAGSCTDVSGTPNASPEIVFQIDLVAGDKLNVKNFGTLDVVWQLIQPCGAGAQACLATYDSTPGAGNGEQTTGLNYNVTTAGTYYVAVESYFPTPMASSTYDLRFVVTHPCGNGMIDAGEACDDGNPTTGDGCTPTCTVEPGFFCTGAPSQCATPEINCNDGIDNNGKFGTDAADPSCAVPAYFPACSAGQNLIVWPSGTLNLPILDNQPANPATSTINVTTGGTIQRAAILYNIAHTWDSDVFVTLSTPLTMNMDVCSGNGSSGDNFVNTVLDTTCTPLVTGGTAPFTNCYKPETSFASLTGTSPTGAWTLRAGDNASGIAGTLQNWSLVLCTQ
ncbi:MAG: DUF4215 domain-containing protein [Polyangiaceae bacterium]